MYRRVFVSVVAALSITSSLLFAADLEVETSIDKDKVAVGEDVVFTVTITNNGTTPRKMKGLTFGKGGLEVAVTMGTGVSPKPIHYVYTHIVGDASRPQFPAEETLAPGKSITGSAKVPALVPGVMTLSGILWGKTKLQKSVSLDVTGKGREVQVKIETSEGDMQARFYTGVAPNTVAHFIRAARDGFYNGLTFHRIIKGFMIQGGDPSGDGTGGPGYNLPAEFNKKLHLRGVLSMARASNPDSAGSQFFIMDGKSPSLDGQYTGFGELVSGKETLAKIVNLPVRSNGRERSTPLNPPKIKKMTVVSAEVK